jgi:hypothetical protein
MALAEQAEAHGEPPEDPLLLFRVLYGFWSGSLMQFKGEVVRELAIQFLSLAKRQESKVPYLLAERMMGHSLLMSGDVLEARKHYDQAIALYSAAEHGPLATRFGYDVRVAILGFRAWALWLLGYPNTALKDADEVISDARDIGQASGLMVALCALGPTSSAGITQQQWRDPMRLSH